MNLYLLVLHVGDKKENSGIFSSLEEVKGHIIATEDEMEGLVDQFGSVRFLVEEYELNIASHIVIQEVYMRTDGMAVWYI